MNIQGRSNHMLNRNTSARQAAVVNLSIIFKRTEYKNQLQRRELLDINSRI